MKWRKAAARWARAAVGKNRVAMSQRLESAMAASSDK